MQQLDGGGRSFRQHRIVIATRLRDCQTQLRADAGAPGKHRVADRAC